MKKKENTLPKVNNEKLFVSRYNERMDNDVVNPTPAEFVQQNNISKSRLLIILLTAVLLLLIPIGGAIAGIWWYTDSFAKAAKVDREYLFNTLKAGYDHNPFQNKSSVNILFLGLDQVGQNRQNSLLTDTILFINLTSNGQLKVIPLPRDLWVDDLKTKVNALYYYGEKSQDITGEQLVEKTLEQITGTEIDYNVVLNLDTVKLIIDQVGGVDVEVEHGFVDEQFPRDDVAPDILPVEARYKTVAFETGWQHMDGNRALEFIRSRKSSDNQENTDESRSKRQQKIIFALLNHLTKKENLTRPELYGNLYAIWHEHIQTNISDTDIIGFVKQLSSTTPTIKIINIPIQTTTTAGIIFNPPIKKHQQWVYEPIDPTWIKFADFFQHSLESSQD